MSSRSFRTELFILSHLKIETPSHAFFLLQVPIEPSACLPGCYSTKPLPAACFLTSSLVSQNQHVSAIHFPALDSLIAVAQRVGRSVAFVGICVFQCSSSHTSHVWIALSTLVWFIFTLTFSRVHKSCNLLALLTFPIMSAPWGLIITYVFLLNFKCIHLFVTPTYLLTTLPIQQV